jgi:Uma2 family endonuclease
MTTEELLAMPEDGIERWLINGELREKPMTIRNFMHTGTTTRVAQFLANWLDGQARPRGRVLTGDAGVRLNPETETTFGVDILYLSAELAATLGRTSRIVEGVPTLAVEILSPSNTVDELSEKRTAMLEAGVSLVWFIDPDAKTVVVYRPDAKPQLFNEDQELIAEPHLPGFRVSVSKLFE